MSAPSSSSSSSSSLSTSSSSCSAVSASPSVKDEIPIHVESLDATESVAMTDINSDFKTLTTTATTTAITATRAPVKGIFQAEADSMSSFVNDVRPVFIVSSTGERFQLTRKQASMSMLLRTTFMTDKDATDIVISYAGSSRVMNRVVAYLRHHNGATNPVKTFVSKPLRSNQILQNCSDIWSAEFIDNAAEHKRDTVMQLALTANYMDISCLLYLAVARSVCMIKGETEENISKNSSLQEPCLKHQSYYQKATMDTETFVAQCM